MLGYGEIKDYFIEEVAWVKEYIQPIWNLLSEYVYLQVLILITFGYLLAKILSKYLPYLFILLLDKYDTSNRFDVIRELLVLIQKLILQIFFLLGIIIALKFSDVEITVVVTIVKSIMVMVIGLFLSSVIKTILQKLAEGNQSDDTKLIQAATLPLFENTISLVAALGIIYEIFSLWGIDITALMASAGIAAMAIGMAMKDTLADVIAGILILTDPPFRIGDNIQVNKSIRGAVTKIGMRNTRIFTDENIEVIVPNALIGNSQVINESSSNNQKMRIQFNVYVAYGTDVERIRSLLLSIAMQSKNILNNEPSFVRLSSVDIHSIRLGLYGWIANPQKRSSTIAELNELTYMLFLKEGIEMALPRQEEVAIVEHVKLEQEISIKEFPNEEKRINITSFPETKQEIKITEFPDTKQEIKVTEFPNTKQALFVKEMPNLFGTAKAKTLTKTPKASPDKKEKILKKKEGKKDEK